MPFEKDPFVEHLAGELISKHHPRLAGVKIAYVMNTSPSPAKTRLGKKRKLGSAARTSEKVSVATNTDYDFIIEIRQDLWSRMDLETQEALLDHELCHCGVDGDGCYLIDHDVTEFREIIERHGFWQRDLKEFYTTSKTTAEQRKLDFENPPPGDNGKTDPNAGKDVLSVNGTPVLTIDMDKKCKRCHKKGATGSGLCMGCIAKGLQAGEFDHALKPSVS